MLLRGRLKDRHGVVDYEYLPPTAAVAWAKAATNVGGWLWPEVTANDFGLYSIPRHRERGAIVVASGVA